MKLTPEQIATIEKQTDALPIPEDNEANTALVEIFGDNTYYADQNGLCVLEPTVVDDGTQNLVEVIQIAAWANDTKDELQPIDPQKTGAILSLVDLPADE